MTTILDVLKVLDAAAPLRLAMDFDNPGFLVGRGKREVTKIIVALDITADVIKEAKEKGAELIVSHHPVIFGERKTVTDCDVTGSIVVNLIENGISAICMHTNLDSARGGVNDVLAQMFGIKNAVPVEPVDDGSVGCGRYGELECETTMPALLSEICKKLSCEGVRYYDAGRKVKKVVVGGGACGEYIKLAKKLGCDTVITADIKHNQFLDARELSINAVDAGHFATENIICPRLCEIIKESFPDMCVNIAEINTDTARYFTIFER